jgi:hypothetical protein
MHDFFHWNDAAPVLITAMLAGSVALVLVGGRIASEWRKRHLGAMRMDLTRAMVEAGMSADDIVRVLHAATEADEVVRVLQAAKGGSPAGLSATGTRPDDSYRLQAADSRR